MMTPSPMTHHLKHIALSPYHIARHLNLIQKLA